MSAWLWYGWLLSVSCRAGKSVSAAHRVWLDRACAVHAAPGRPEHVPVCSELHRVWWSHLLSTIVQRYTPAPSAEHCTKVSTTPLSSAIYHVKRYSYKCSAYLLLTIAQNMGTPVCRLCGRYLALLGRPIRVTVPAVTVAPTALVGSLIRSSNLPHSLQRGVHARTPSDGKYVYKGAYICVPAYKRHYVETGNSYGNR